MKWKISKAELYFQSYELSWSVDSYSPIEEYRLLYRKIKPYHGVSVITIRELIRLCKNRWHCEIYIFKNPTGLKILVL